jgi:transcriptional regulator with XRE-family HTH domain
LRNSLTLNRRDRILANMKPLAQLLFEWRDMLKLSRAEAARRCQMSQVQWTELESGATRDPRTSTLQKLTDGTGIPLERLVAASCLSVTPPSMKEPAALAVV